MKEMKRILSLILCLVMLVGVLPVNAIAAETAGKQVGEAVASQEAVSEESAVLLAEALSEETTDEALTAALEEAKEFTDALTINNSSNDPATVVSTFGTHFTWDNEKRESSKSYLFDWSYYNGVVFEGLEYLYEVTGEESYKDYVVEYMSNLVASDGTWAMCSNNTAKQCAGYISTHGADCYKTASLLMDAYEMTGDSRYLTIAQTLYADLDTAAGSYSLSNAGNNFRHTWATDPSPDLWLDGLYMILPFRAEYAKYIGDTEELDLIVDRMQWVSDNMYDDATGLFYHAADSASSNSGTFWLRSIGWYAAAIVDIMDSMEGDNFTAMQAQLVKLVDGMKACQNASNGMWLNNMAASQSSSNPYETSGTALVCYAVMKAVNNGWLDESYADMATLAFKGICEEKLDGETLTDICFKGAPGSSNSTFYDNEGKGVGPFIMLYAEVQEYVNASAETEPTEATVTYVDNILTIQATALGLTDIAAENVTGEPDLSAYYSDYVTYNVSLTGHTEGNTVKYSFLVPENMDTTNLSVYYIPEDGELVSVPCTLVTDAQGNQYVEFTTTYVGTFALGATTVPEGYSLYEITVSNVVTTKYLVGDSLDLVNPVVTAVYKKDGSEDFTRVIGVQDDPTYETSGYDMTVAGKQTVTITYEGCTTSFDIEVFNKVFPDETTGITAEVAVPGTTAITAAVSENANVQTAMSGILETYAAYDITLEGYINGKSVIVTMPIASGDGEACVYYVPKSGAAVKLEGVEDNGTTVTFTTDHFSTYVTGRVAEVTGTGYLPGGYVYTQVTSITAGGEYVIVANDDAVALMDNNGTMGSQSVTISGTTLTSDTALTEWTFSNSSNGTVYNGSRYLRYSNNAFSLNANQSSTVYITDNGDNFKISGSGNRTGYALYYTGSSWSTSGRNTAQYVRLYQFTKQSSGAEVTFTVTPGSATIQPDGTVILNGTVTVAGENVDLSDCTITWASDNGDVATVSGGTVTGVADGTANITVTLSAVDGTALQESIVLTIPVTVQSKTISSVSLSGSEGYVVHKKGDTTVITDADGNDITITVTYDDGSTDDVPLTLGMISGDGLDTTTDGVYTGLTVTYNGTVLSTDFTLNVVQNPGNNFPEYPEEGSVEVNKVIGDVSQFQNTGVAEVQLSTSGIPIKTGVNVLLIMDISNSMSWDDTEYDYNDTDITAGTNQRLNISRASAKEFANELLANYEDGTATKNTLTILNFAGIDGDYNSHDEAKLGDNDDVYQLGELAMQDASVVESYLDSDDFRKATTGGTNYDYAFQQAYALSEQLYNLNGQAVYIVFMTDGVPTHYNGVYYKSRSNTDLTACMQYVDPVTGEVSGYTSTGNDRNGNDIDATATKTITVYYNDGTTEQKTVTYNKGWSDYVTGNLNGWAEKVKALDYVAKVYSIGFGMANGSVTQGATTSMPTLEGVNGGTYYVPSDVTHELLGNMASTEEDHFEVDDEEQMTALYKSLAAQIRQAATNAYFVDQMGSSFELQLGNYVKKFEGTNDETVIALDPAPAIEVSTYKIYKSSDVGTTIDGVEVTEDMVGQRYGDPTVIETVVFNADGTEAYSSLNGGYTVPEETTTDSEGNVIQDYTGTNILIDGVICAQNFWYNTTKVTQTITLADGSTYDLPAETFYWNIGTINELEFVLSYYVYLSGASEGQAQAGTYATNNYATLYYENWLGNDVNQSVQSPVLSWESASVYYGFYLVNQEGEPIVNQATGLTGSFADAVKITNRIFHSEVFLNDIENVNATIEVSSTLVPDEYAIYDAGAKYTITIDSGNKASGWVIENTVDPDTTYVTDYRGTESTNIEHSSDLVDQTGMDYTATTVWFAVYWTPQALPDTVVIDYGLPVDISVLSNDMFGSAGKLVGIGAISALPENYETTFTSEVDTAKFGESYTGTYGTAKADTTTGKVRYTPANMEMNGYEKFAYAASYSTTATDGTETMRYYYSTVTVIPATTIYYEDSFLSYGASGTEWEDEGTAVDGATQAEDRPGKYSLTDANNIYGYDSVNLGMSTYSLGTAKKVHVDASSYATASFTFYGTGFDVISMTSNTTGTIAVQVKLADGQKDVTIGDNTYSAGQAVASKVVNTYYGYTYNEETSEWVHTPDVNKAMYQVPVLQIEQLPYAKYDVTITATYADIFDKTTDAGYWLYLDAIRIYDPANDGAADGSDDTIIEDAYKADGEAWPSYIELRNQIITQDTFGSVATNTVVTGLVFIDGDAEVGDAQMTDYVSYGPNNEIYLAPGQRVAFMLSDVTGSDGKSIIANVHLGVKSADGKTASWTITNISEDGTYYGAKTETINTTTDMYYDISSWRNDIIVISNYTKDTGTEGILSLTNVKVTYTEDPNGTETTGAETVSEEGSADTLAVSYTADTVYAAEGSNEAYIYMTPAAATLTLRTVNTMYTEPEVEETEPTEPETEPTEPETEPTEPETEPTEPEKPSKPGKDEKPGQNNKPGHSNRPSVNNRPGHKGFYMGNPVRGNQVRH